MFKKIVLREIKKDIFVSGKKCVISAIRSVNPRGRDKKKG